VAVISGVRDPMYLDWTPPAGWVLAVTAEWTGVKTSIYYLPNNAGGRTAETFNIAGSGYHDQILHILEYSGVMTVNPLDKTAVMEQDASPPSGYVQTGFTANTVQPKELVITGLTVDGQGEFYSPSDGFVELYDHNMLWHLTSATHERMTTTAWSQGHSATVTVPGAQYVGVVATFKSANTN